MTETIRVDVRQWFTSVNLYCMQKETKQNYKYIKQKAKTVDGEKK